MITSVPIHRIVFQVPDIGVYQLHLQDANQGGLQHCVYQLSIVCVAFADGVDPLGGTRGTTIPMELMSGGDVLRQNQGVIGGDPGDRFLLPGQPRGRGVASSVRSAGRGIQQ